MSSLSARVASRRKPHAMPFSATPEIPPIGFGTFPLTGEAAREAVLMAIGLGYRHIDTAQMYGNERRSARPSNAAACRGPICSS